MQRHNLKNKKDIRYNLSKLWIILESFSLLKKQISCASIVSILFATACSPVFFTGNKKNYATTPSPTPEDPCLNKSCNESQGPFYWDSSDWSDCSQKCGGGTQTRSVSCKDNKKQIVTESNCSETKAPSTRACNTDACTPSSPTYYWSVSTWSACSASCGGGTQTRSAFCQTSTGVTGDSNCTATKPVLTQVCNTQTCPPTYKDMTKEVYVDPSMSQLDILLVVDDSSSMTIDNQKLAARLGGFVNQLQSVNIDWQMCVTTTDVGYYEGRPIQWTGANSHILTKNSGYLPAIFQQTIADIGSGFSNDEQGIKATVLSILNNTNSHCNRTGAANAVIIISDEDERSVGGVYNLSSAQHQSLTAQNFPSHLLQIVQNQLSYNNKPPKFKVNSVVVKDNVCEQIQDAQGTPSFIGTKYMELSNLTAGPITSICESDYSASLQYFKQDLEKFVSSVSLDCTPLNGAVTTDLPNTTAIKLEGNQLSFTPALGIGTKVKIQYRCGI